MAWNQPGQNNPWGRRPGQGGGPDLDERVKSWQRRLEALFRPGGGRGNESRSLFILLAAVAVAVFILSGFFQIKAAEQGVILRFGKLVDIRQQGWGWRWPWVETLIKVNVASVNSSEYKSRVLTSDVNLVDLRFAVQYQLSDPKKILFAVKDPEATLSEVSEMAIREVVGRSELDNVLVGKTRPEITRRTKELIQHTLDNYNTGITITTVNLTDVQVPEAVIPSQRDANKALADQERFVKESQAYANSIIPVAQGAAARMQQDGEAYKSQVTAIAEGQTSRFLQLQQAYSQAPEVTRKRLYMDTIENVLSRAHKVLIDTKAGGASGGNMFYLPLDKLLEKANARDGESSGVITGRGDDGSAVSGQKSEPDSVTVEARGRGDR
ncbi:MAG TPA: FtsH protease activity modulator HflK [Steroidobacteraceae bacterium]|nr:FtsH protease activity modulator HflK [Steroidobacteraceae bacterium]